MTDERIAEFIGSLRELDRGGLARLRRNAGETLGTSRDAMGVFYRILPRGLAGGFDEEIYFLVATLYALNRKPSVEGNFGATMGRIKTKSKDKVSAAGKVDKQQKADALDRRMAVLLDSEFGLVDGGKRAGGELAYRLRQLVRLAASKDVGVNWEQLLSDLLWWGHPNRKTRKEWARSYYAGETSEESGDSKKRRGIKDASGDPHDTEPRSVQLEQG